VPLGHGSRRATLLTAAFEIVVGHEWLKMGFGLKDLEFATHSLLGL